MWLLSGVESIQTIYSLVESIQTIQSIQRKQYVRLNGVDSAIVSLQAGVPQGSVLGPVLFSAFLAPLANVIDLFGISHHQYADDTSLYYSFSPAEQIGSVELISNCLSAVNNWFLTNGLLVNPGKSDSNLYWNICADQQDQSHWSCYERNFNSSVGHGAIARSIA